MGKTISKALAFDFGASSGRAIVGSFDGEKLSLEEIHRFSNDPVMVSGNFHWDVLRLFYEIKQGITASVNLGYRDIKTIGIDTWGVDYGLIAKSGKLLQNPYHYRDSRTTGMDEVAFKRVSKDEIYDKTGIQFMFFNTIFQLVADTRSNADSLWAAEDFLMMPDLFNYFLTGEKFNEWSNASTTQLFNPIKGDWEFDLIDRLGIPRKIFKKIVDSGTKIGKLSDDICNELGCEKIDVVAVASHDTGSAVAAVPAADKKNYAYISSGTWSLMGLELEKPLINEQARAVNITNEGGVNRTTRLLKNIMGLWMIQETRRQWEREGEKVTFSHIEELTKQSKPFQCFVDVDNIMFATPGNMPRRIREYCEKTGQYVPQSKGEIARCIYDSLAMKYRATLEILEKLNGESLECIHIIGGGVKDGLLCQMTANACEKQVFAGPIEATAIGNIIVQFISQGVIKDINQARRIVENSFVIEDYQSEDSQIWAEEYKQYLKIIAMEVK